MKRVVMILLVSFLCMSNSLYAGNGDFTISGSLGVGNTSAPAASAVVDITSPHIVNPANPKKGLLPPRMTTADRNAVASPAAGLLIYNTTENAYNYYTGSSWVALGDQAGTVKTFAGQTPPNGWLECNGQAVSRAGYANLFAVIGTTFGAGDGSTTFNLPDLRGEFVRGWDNGRGVDNGRILGSVQADELKSHDHTMKANDIANDWSHVMRGGSGGGVNNAKSGWVNPTGGSETRPRNVALMYIIKY